MLRRYSPVFFCVFPFTVFVKTHESGFPFSTVWSYAPIKRQSVYAGLHWHAAISDKLITVSLCVTNLYLEVRTSEKRLLLGGPNVFSFHHLCSYSAAESVSKWVYKGVSKSFRTDHLEREL
jgi:hypothetical protein